MARLYFRWLVWRLILRSPPIATFAGGIRFGGFVTFSEYWMRNKGLDEEDIDVIKAVLASEPGPAVAVDIGANLGLFSLVLAKAGYNRVYSFEPIPDTFQRFNSNLVLNANLARSIIPTQAGIGAEETVAEFMMSEKSPGQNKIAPAGESPTGSAARVRCPLHTLSGAFDRLKIDRARFLKIDVEGYESAVIQGAMPILKSGRVDFIYSEVIPEALLEAGSSVEKYADILDEAGFHPVIFNYSRHQFETIDFAAAKQAAGLTRNVLFQYRNL